MMWNSDFIILKHHSDPEITSSHQKIEKLFAIYLLKAEAKNKRFIKFTRRKLQNIKWVCVVKSNARELRRFKVNLVRILDLCDIATRYLKILIVGLFV